MPHVTLKTLFLNEEEYIEYKKDKKKNSFNKYYLKNKNDILKQQKQYRQLNKEHYKKYYKLYYELHKPH